MNGQIPPFNMDDSSIRHPWFNYLSKGNLLGGTVKIRIQARCAISLQFASRSQALCIFLFCAPARREFAASLPLSYRYPRGGNFNDRAHRPCFRIFTVLHPKPL